MIVGCYDMHLYCDGIDCEAGGFRGRAQFETTDEYGSRCRRRARKAGWRLLRNGGAVCPSCVNRKAKVAEPS